MISTTLSRLNTYGRMIKFSHTAFAMPFALASYLLAGQRYGFNWRTLFWVAAAMVGARSAAMMFNRIADRDVDARNPRTSARELPSGEVTLGEAWVFLAAATAVFVFAAWKLNPLCLALSPVALTVIFGYSLTKRFTWASHLALGLALGVAPVGAWLAVAGRIDWPPLLLMLAVLAWVAGFDILYACQDADVDRSLGLHSIPARFGTARALRVSELLHLGAVLALLVLHVTFPLGWAHGAGVAAVAVLLVMEHRMVRPDDPDGSHGVNLSKIPAAFFTVNAALGAVYFLFVAAEVALRHFSG